MKLVYESSGIEVSVGDNVLLDGGEVVKVEQITKPHKPSSTGRVCVEILCPMIDGTFKTQSLEYFPSVIDAKWIEREDQIPEFQNFINDHISFFEVK